MDLLGKGKLQEPIWCLIIILYNRLQPDHFIGFDIFINGRNWEVKSFAQGHPGA